jgi:hypothetical protein
LILAQTDSEWIIFKRVLTSWKSEVNIVLCMPFIDYAPLLMEPTAKRISLHFCFFCEKTTEYTRSPVNSTGSTVLSLLLGTQTTLSKNHFLALPKQFLSKKRGFSVVFCCSKRTNWTRKAYQHSLVVCKAHQSTTCMAGFMLDRPRVHFPINSTTHTKS